MNGIVLPAPADVDAVISDYLSIVLTQVSARDERANTILRCQAPFLLLIAACELAASYGVIESLTFNAFMHDVTRQTASVMNRSSA